MIRNWRYHLSKLVPVPMRSTYSASDGIAERDERASWWQWRGRVFAHRIVLLSLAMFVMLIAPAAAQTAGDVDTGGAIQTGIGLVLLGLTVKAVLGFVKVLRHQEWNAVLTTLTWWVVGIGALVAFAQTQWAEGIDLWGTKLSDAGTWEIIVLGINASSLGIFANENLKAKDNTDSASQPPLFAQGGSAPASGNDPDYTA